MGFEIRVLEKSDYYKILQFSGYFENLSISFLTFFLEKKSIQNVYFDARFFGTLYRKHYMHSHTKPANIKPLAIVQYVGKRQAHLSDFIKFWWKNLCL